jgi:PAS domain S-box-containing protein
MDFGTILQRLVTLSGDCFASPVYKTVWSVCNIFTAVMLLFISLRRLSGKNRTAGDNYFSAITALSGSMLLCSSVILYSNLQMLYLTLSAAAAVAIVIPGIKMFIQAQQEHKNKREQLRKLQSEFAMLRTITDTSPDILYVYDLHNNTVEYINQAVSEILGFTSEQLQNMKDQLLQQTIHPDDLQTVMQSAENLKNLKDNSTDIIELRVKDSSGNWRWMNSFQKPFRRNNNGEVTHVVGVSRDISRKKEAEEKLRAYKKFIEKVNATSPNTIYVLDVVNLRHIYTSRDIVHQYGEMSEGAEFIRYLHPDDQENWYTHLDHFRTAADNDIRSVEYRVRDKEGSWRWIYSREAVFERDENNLVTQIVGVATDITERKKTEEQLQTLNQQLEEMVEERTRELQHNQEKLRQNEALLKLITNTIPAYVSYLNNNETIRFANEHYINLTGQREPVSGKYLHEAFGEENYKKCRQVFVKAAAGETVSCQIKLPLTSGEQKFINLSYVPDKDENGAVKGLVVMGVDLTERVEYENQLRNKNAELKRINRELDNFIYAASHDLKTPISNMEGLVNSIFEDIQHSCKNEIALMFEMIGKSIIRLKNTITDLSDISKIQRESVREELQEVNILSVINEFRTDYSREIAATGTIIETSFEVTSIRFSRKNLRSVLYNLLSNAIRYRKPEMAPVIRIKSVYLKTDCILISVSDNGLGLDARQKEKIFGMFKRLHSHVEGSGIGLYIVKKIMENAGGKVNVHSSVGKGAVFRLYFPVL